MSYNIKRIAELVGVSVATISRYFSNNSKVSEETANRIEQVCTQLGYSPRKYKHRVLRSESIVGIIVADLSNTFFIEIINAITETLNKHKMEVIICNSNESPENEIRQLAHLSKITSGIIISPVNESIEYNSEYIETINKTTLPIVLLDRDTKSGRLSGVFQNSYSGAMQAVKTLINNGHQYIGMLSGPITTKPGLERLSGYMDCLRLYNIPIVSDYIMYCDFLCETAEKMTFDLLSAHPEITAIFSANNAMAIGAYRGIKRLGLSVPEDIALISYGEINPGLSNSSKSITVLYQPTREIGEQCANILLDRITNKSRNVKRITLDSQLILRGTEIYPPNRK